MKKIDSEVVMVIKQKMGNKSIREFSSEFEINRGYLSLVLSGKRPASKNLRKALGICPAPRRKYYLTTKEARAVAVRILGILWQ